MASASFVPRRTTRLRTPASMDLDVIRIGRAFGDRIQHVVGIHVRFGGSCFDVTWDTEENALKAATDGVAIDGELVDLRPLGQKKTDVSVFVAVEFPDASLREILKRYGEFEPDIRRLKLKETGLKHIENGVRVVSFRKITSPIPNTIVYQGLPIGFRYTGQVKLCFKCASPDHEVRDCPQRNNARQEQEPTPEQGQHDSDASGDEEQNEEQNMDTTAQRQATKRTRPESDTEERPPKLTVTDDDSTFDPSQSLFATASTVTTDSELTDSEHNKQTDNNTAQTGHTDGQDGFKPVTGEGFKRMLAAIKKKGKTRTEMMQAVPGAQYYQARALWLQYTHGDFSERAAEKQHCRENESDRWSQLSGCIKQDAYAQLLELYGSLRDKYGLFTAK